MTQSSTSRPELLYLAPRYDPGRIEASGREHFCVKELERWADVAIEGPWQLVPSAAHRLANRIRRSLYLPRLAEKYSLNLARRQSSLALERVSIDDPDIVMSAFPGPLAFLAPTAAKVVLYTDATMASIDGEAAQPGGYDTLHGLARRSITQGHEIDRRAIARADLVICVNHWAHESVVSDYGKREDQVTTIAAGGSLPEVPEASVADDRRAPGAGEPLRLLFVGNDWWRKGGDLAIRTLQSLSRDRKVELTTMGRATSSTEGLDRVDGLFVAGELDKNTEHGRRRYDEEMRRAHVLLQPSRQEPCALVFAEACAYGLPIVTHAVGGVATAVADQLNGRLAQLASSPGSLVEAIRNIVSSPERYRSYVQAAREAFEQDLNWTVSGHRMRRALKTLLED